MAIVDDPQLEQKRVIEWRWAELTSSGYPTAAALELAQRSDVDLHRAVDLALACGDPLLAIDILL